MAELISESEPVKIFDKFIRDLKESHKKEPFTVENNGRPAAERIIEIATGYSLRPCLYRGSTIVTGASGNVEVTNRVWVQVLLGDGNKSREKLADPYPFQDEEFFNVLKNWVAGEISGETLVDLSRLASFETRVFGDPPHTVRYYGGPSWSSERARLPLKSLISGNA